MPDEPPEEFVARPVVGVVDLDGDGDDEIVLCLDTHEGSRLVVFQRKGAR
jgi:hypothetical protein